MAAWRVLNMLTQCEHLDCIIYTIRVSNNAIMKSGLYNF